MIIRQLIVPVCRNTKRFYVLSKGPSLGISLYGSRPKLQNGVLMTTLYEMNPNNELHSTQFVFQPKHIVIKPMLHYFAPKNN